MKLKSFAFLLKNKLIKNCPPLNQVMVQMLLMERAYLIQMVLIPLPIVKTNGFLQDVYVLVKKVIQQIEIFSNVLKVLFCVLGTWGEYARKLLCYVGQTFKNAFFLLEWNPKNSACSEKWAHGARWTSEAVCFGRTGGVVCSGRMALGWGVCFRRMAPGWSSLVWVLRSCALSLRMFFIPLGSQLWLCSFCHQSKNIYRFRVLYSPQTQNTFPRL